MIPPSRSPANYPENLPPAYLAISEAMADLQVLCFRYNSLPVIFSAHPMAIERLQLNEEDDDLDIISCCCDES